MKQKVSITTDVAVLLSVVTPHNYFPVVVPPLPPPGIYPHIELPVSMYWPPGMGVGANKFTANVKHQGKTIALDGHDCGILIVHVSVPPVPFNAFYPLIIPFSSRRMMFSASTVKMNGAATGTSDLLSVPTPMLACGVPYSIPLVFPLTNASNTVNVGMSAADFAAGYFALAFTAVAEAILHALAGAPGAPGGKDVLAAFLGGGDVRELLIKNAAAAAAGLVKIALTGEGTIELGVGSPFGGLKVTATRSKDGTWTFGGEGSFLEEKYGITDDGTTTHTDNGWTGPTTTSTTEDDAGNTTVTRQRTEYDWMTGDSETSTHTEKYDKNGNLTEVDGQPVPPGTQSPGSPVEDAQSALLDDAPIL